MTRTRTRACGPLGVLAASMVGIALALAMILTPATPPPPEPDPSLEYCGLWWWFREHPDQNPFDPPEAQ